VTARLASGDRSLHPIRHWFGHARVIAYEQSSRRSMTMNGLTDAEDVTVRMADVHLANAVRLV